MKVSIPLESGHFVISASDLEQGSPKVSIPLESGHFVMLLC